MGRPCIPIYRKRRGHFSWPFCPWSLVTFSEYALEDGRKGGCFLIFFIFFVHADHASPPLTFGLSSLEDHHSDRFMDGTLHLDSSIDLIEGKSRAPWSLNLLNLDTIIIAISSALQTRRETLIWRLPLRSIEGQDPICRALTNYYVTFGSFTPVLLAAQPHFNIRKWSPLRRYPTCLSCPFIVQCSQGVRYGGCVVLFGRVTRL